MCAGLVYVSLASRPPAFDGLRVRFEVAGAPQGFDRARIAHVADYEVEANWKLVWENNRECYHCTPRHPQYVKSNFDVYEEEHASEAVRQKIAAAIARIETKWAVPGDGVAHPAGGLATFPDPDNGIWYTCNRTALAEGFATESMDGARVAPLMGDYPSADVGVLRMRSLPNFWLHASCDHAVVTRMLPAGLRKTRMRSYWLVHRDAREGRGLRARPPVALLASHQRAGLGNLQVAAEEGSNRSASCPARCRSGRNTTSTRSSAGTCRRYGRRAAAR